jgi:hypothetical protein
VKSDDVGFLLFFGVVIIVFLFGFAMEADIVDAPKYREEAYTLEDGTLCTIIHGSSYAGIWSITCNYNQHRIGGES